MAAALHLHSMPRIAGLGLVLVLTAQTGHAAMRRCYKTVVAEGRDDGSQTQAHRKAVAAWIEAARAIGPGFTRFDLAIDRHVACRLTPAGEHVCRASGAPCTIEHNPKPPRGADKGKGIDL